MARNNKKQVLKKQHVRNKFRKSFRKGKEKIKHLSSDPVQVKINREKDVNEVRQEDVIPSEDQCNPLQLLLSTFNGSNNVFTPSATRSRKCSADKESDPDNGSDDEDSAFTNSDNSSDNDAEECESMSSVNGIDDATKNPMVFNNVDETNDDLVSVGNVDENEENNLNSITDPFTHHFDYDLTTSLLESISSDPVRAKTFNLYWPLLHNLKLDIPVCTETNNTDELGKKALDINKKYAEQAVVPELIKELDWNKLNVKSQIQNNIRNANENQLKNSDSEDLTALQKELFSIINNYQDLFYPERNFANSEEIRFVYCLHAVNHILKTRLRILHHNEKLKRKDQEMPEYRDQGLVRPRVVILVPFKESCSRIVNMISSILINEDQGNIINKLRFQEEFGGSELIFSKKNPKPEDYEQLFKGNIDDNFKIGLSFTKKSLKLYSDFYSSDVIIASPLGLRMVIGAQGDAIRDYDFLASVEILILDQPELFLMQNWDHLLLIMDHLHLQPKESHGTDFSRIRSWVLYGWSKFYRQTLILSSITTPELLSLYNRRCFNYHGKCRIVNPVDNGTISQVILQLSHIFQKFPAESASNVHDTRFKIFTETVLPQYKDSSFTGVLIYVPSYFDYVRIRNHLKREDYSFVQICEYSKDGRIARARDKFFHNENRFLLYSERFHFFRRITLKGIRHIIFYQLPTFPSFYSELCNLMREENQNPKLSIDCNASVTTLYCKYDMHQLSAVVKTSRASIMLSSKKEVYMFATG